MSCVTSHGVLSTAGVPSQRGALRPKEGIGAPHPMRRALHRKSGGRLLPNTTVLITAGVPEAMAEVPVQRGRVRLIGNTEAPKPMAVVPARGTTGALLNMKMMIIMVLLEAVGLPPVLRTNVVSLTRELR